MTAEHDQHIEGTLRRTRFVTPAERDEQILAAAMRAMAGAAAPAASRFRIRPTLWRRAAILLLALGAAGALIAYLDRPSLTLAQVAAEFEKQSWVHVTYDNGREEWTNLTDGRYFFKDYDGRVSYTEPGGLRLGWRAQSGFISRDKWFTGDVAPPRRAATAWERVQTYGVPSGAKPDGMKPHEDVLDGRKVVRFDAHIIDILGRRVLVKQVWADPATKLPLRVRDVLNLHDRQAQERDAIVGTFTFPTTGPSSIHDLGVPRGLAIIDGGAKPAEDVASILAAAKAARDRFSKTYRLLVWTPNDDMGAADAIYRDGERFAHTRYFVSDMPGVQPFPKNATAGQVLNWLGTRLPVQQIVDDGQREFSRQNNVFNEPGKPPAEARVTRSHEFSDNPNYLPGSQWPYVNITGAAVKVDPPADAPKGLVVLRRTLGDLRIDHWIDPSKDYACVRNVRQNFVGGKWVDDRVEFYADFVHAEAGLWYATDRRIEMSANTKLGTSASTHHEKIELKVLKPEEIPPATFDGEKLLEGAKVETY